jgi:hypothetical protein
VNIFIGKFGEADFFPKNTPKIKEVSCNDKNSLSNLIKKDGKIVKKRKVGKIVVFCG